MYTDSCSFNENEYKQSHHAVHHLQSLLKKLRVYSWPRNSLQNNLTTRLLSSWNFPYCHVIVDFQIWTLDFLSTLVWGSRIILRPGNSSFATWLFFFLFISLFLPFSRMERSPSRPVCCSWTVAAVEGMIHLLQPCAASKRKRTTSSVKVIGGLPALIIMHVKFFHTF